MPGTLIAKPLYTAGLAFAACVARPFVIGRERLNGADGRASVGTTVGFLLISILGIIDFSGVHDNTVGGPFTGLMGLTVSDVLATVKYDLPPSSGTSPIGRCAGSTSKRPVAHLPDARRGAPW